MTTILITADWDNLIRHFGCEDLAARCYRETLQCSIDADGNANVVCKDGVRFWLHPTMFDEQCSEDELELVKKAIMKQDGIDW